MVVKCNYRECDNYDEEHTFMGRHNNCTLMAHVDFCGHYINYNEGIKEDEKTRVVKCNYSGCDQYSESYRGGLVVNNCMLTTEVELCKTYQNYNKVTEKLPANDPVNSPSHYANKVPGIEAIEVTQHFNFNRGNALKYIWRAGSKGGPDKEIEDLEKAAWYIKQEIRRVKQYGND